MGTTSNDQVKAAYALNMCMVSLSQIIQYNDMNIMKEEYDNIINNINLENIPKHDSLRELLDKILEEITFNIIHFKKSQLIEQEYQHKIENAIWNAVPSIGTIFATRDPVALGLTLATQIGTGYMNYRRNKADYDMAHQRQLFEIEENRLIHLNSLRTSAFNTAWQLAEDYNYPDQLRLTEENIKNYNDVLMEEDDLNRYFQLENIKDSFIAYPHYWYHIGNSANQVYRNKSYPEQIRCGFKDKAISAYDRFFDLNGYNLLRKDTIQATCALEYLDLLDITDKSNLEKANFLIDNAFRNSNENNDIRQLCAFAFLRIKNYDQAKKVLFNLVLKNYNLRLNLQLLSGLYIMGMLTGKEDVIISLRNEYAILNCMIKDEENRKFILPIPKKGTDFKDWKPIWNKDKTYEELLIDLENQNAQQLEDDFNVLQKAKTFYQRPTVIVYDKDTATIADVMTMKMNNQKNELNVENSSIIAIDYKTYESTKHEYETKRNRIIFLGDSDSAKTIYHFCKHDIWDYEEIGLRFVKHQNTVVILADECDNNDLNKLIEIGRTLEKKYNIHIPEGVCTAEFQKIFDSESTDLVEKFAEAFVTTVFAPLVIFGKLIDTVLYGMQQYDNFKARKDIKALQYAILFYKYLESEEAIIKPKSEQDLGKQSSDSNNNKEKSANSFDSDFDLDGDIDF